MNSTLNKIAIFSVGVAVGSFVTWKVLETKYEQLVQEEIKAFKEDYIQTKKMMDDEEESEDPEPDSENTAENLELDLNDYAAIISEESYGGDEMIKKKGDVGYMDRPYPIAPNEYDELYNYEAISLTYYADGILADDMDNIVDDVDSIVGDDFADHFGVYEDDTVFIRNDVRKTDYEICRDVRNYADVAGWSHPMDDE